MSLQEKIEKMQKLHDSMFPQNFRDLNSFIEEESSCMNISRDDMVKILQDFF